MRASLLALAALAGVLLLACGGSDEPSQEALQNPGSGMQGAAPGGGYAQPLDPSAAAGVNVILAGLAAQEAPGAQPAGSIFAGLFMEGQVLEQPVNLQPGKCYTIVATSLGPVQELDVIVYGQIPPLPPGTLAEDSTTGPMATLGGRAGGCWMSPSPLPMPAKIVLRVAKGSGMAAAQVYFK